MMRLLDMQPGDLADLVPQAEQAGEADVSEASARALVAAGRCYSIVDFADAARPRLVLTGGFIEEGSGRAMAWARIAALTPRKMARVTRIVRGVIEAANYRRTVMLVRTGFGGGHRWALHLGFYREGTLAEHEPGVDFDLYARMGGRHG